MKKILFIIVLFVLFLPSCEHSEDEYNLVKKTSYDEGYNAGYSEGEFDGYDKGYEDGYAMGQKENNFITNEDDYELGYNEGYDIGYNEGYEKGVENEYCHVTEEVYSDNDSNEIMNTDNNSFEADIKSSYNAELFEISGLYTAEIIDKFPNNRMYYSTYYSIACITDIFIENGQRYVAIETSELPYGTLLKLKINNKLYKKIMDVLDSEDRPKPGAIIFQYSEIIPIQPTLFMCTEWDFDYGYSTSGGYCQFDGSIIVGDAIDIVY